jgi:hypothetical protein
LLSTTAQHRLDGNPFMIGEFVAHDSSPRLRSLNHRGSAKRNAAGRPVRRPRAEANINVPTTLAKSVENDLKRTRLRRLPILAALAYCALDRWIMV